MKKLAVFASGSGTNAENLIRYFASSQEARVVLVLSNRKEAKVLERAQGLGVETFVFDREMFFEGETVVQLLREREVDYVALAGFLWLVPQNLLMAYAGKMVNVHPALLPRHGGKGMYGDRIHRAVVEAGDTESGITIHHVNEKYDSGDVIAQYKVKVAPEDTPEQVAEKVHALEYKYFPVVIEQELKNMKS